ncbi:MAG TPA: BolA family transcriptional regulator [Paenalcaligenes hominis]|uniref:BolA family transcriptional regulator n=1 Tax=Paenalcaligenes hominis TaxID=643674 RepID=A0A9D2VEA8_9BURK|nr:BolA family protein [Paenalcaligenes hominis]NJB63821.1 BolA protein [Paenalcaligenes hominis]GGE60877.1 BolA family transcriptional regulator [Paenalcaligenes hominis]HJH23335.1 BolA family transcriptional regulator [Paenalcaligenes hominis]
MSKQELIELVTQRMQALNPTYFDLIDESHLHEGHAGAKGGASHFRVVIASDQFDDLNTVAKHRLIYQQVTDLMPLPIHALAIEII